MIPTLTARASMETQAAPEQDKEQEVAFFANHAREGGEHNVFTESSTRRIVQQGLEMSGLQAGALIADLGCGSGVFTQQLREHGMEAFGLDLSEALLRVGQRTYANVNFIVGDVERLPVQSASLDGLFMSGIVHHLPNVMRFAEESFRVLKPGGVFVAFDPNRRNPLMWLYRDRSSPFYSARGVTPNERPILAGEVANVFSNAGFSVSSEFCSVQYRYIASARLRWALPLYNALERVVFHPKAMRPYRAFVLTRGVKPCQAPQS